MKRPVKLALLFAVAAAVGHVGLVYVTPHFLMNIAMKRISQDGKLINQFYFGPRTTQNSRGVVRPSPDLAYSSCAYDLSGGPLLIEAQPSPDNGYVSISVFAANTDNIAVFDSAINPQGIRFVLAREGQATPAGEKVVISPSDKGIVLDRRLAPSAERFAAIDPARRGDKCQPI
ncbi:MULTISPECIES: DUF1254 domain-containing protein [unclassified Novosphingobium]|uniref:DUF1254 domain-containing protein n=1 Tax=unclassified Novosphingobium TaxID=2644732 RepID=UPI0025FBD3C6|nr:MULTISPECIES: DUF1254 domain-containing protein [unclassified Novosphingobium]HQV02831.1 DUF1254 domain-containing protein [Novosphingobium sp.]